MIINTRTNLKIAKNVSHANRIWSRFFGLMGKARLKEQSALVIYPCQQVHTFFMRFPIDCIFFDKNHSVVYLAENIKPWHVSNKIPQAFGVIEVKNGVIKKTNTKVSDQLEIRY